MVANPFVGILGLRGNIWRRVDVDRPNRQNLAGGQHLASSTCAEFYSSRAIFDSGDGHIPPLLGGRFGWETDIGMGCGSIAVE